MRNSIWPVLLVLGFPAFLFAEDKITIKQSFQPGQSWKFDMSDDMNMETTTISIAATQSTATNEHSHYSGKVQVLTVKDGVPTSIKVTYDDTCESSHEEKTPFPYSGKTVTVKRGDDGAITDDFTGQADETSASHLHDMLGNQDMLIAKRPLAVGDEWSPDAVDLARILKLQDPKSAGSMKVKLLSVENIDGRPTATFNFLIDAIDMSGGFNYKLLTKGIGMIDLGTGLTTKIDMTGTLMMSGDILGMHVQGSGTIDAKNSSELILANPSDHAPTQNNLPPTNPPGN